MSRVRTTSEGLLPIRDRATPLATRVAYFVTSSLPEHLRHHLEVQSSSQTASQKKQQSISSFFSTKPTPTPTPSKPGPPAFEAHTHEHNDAVEGNDLFVSDDEGPNDGARKKSRTPKRTLDEDDDDSTPPLKRARTNGEDGEQDSQPSRLLDQRVSLQSVSSNVPRAKKPKVTGRTSKYMFSSSPLPQDENDDEEDDEESRRHKERLHQKFVKKLGKPDSIADIKRRNHFITEETQDDEDAGGDAEAEETPEPAASKSKGRKAAAPKRAKDKLTPMERQVIDIKRKHMDTLLVVEVGYKFRFFGEDARIAAKELNIVCIPGKFRFDEHSSEAHIDRFASASIPVHRLHVHVKRLVSAGHKVGVVRQLETAALKAAGDNRNKAFERGLTNLYTKGTYIDDQEGLDAPVAAPEGGAPATGHLLCLTETNAKGWGTDEKVQIGLVAVQPATGDIVYDDFEDGWMRSELETRLLHIAPCEFLIVGDVSKATEKLVQHLSGSKTNVFGDKARVERVEKPKTMAAQAYSHITKFYADKMASSDEPLGSQVQSSQETGTLLDKVHKLSENATICLSAMITHLTDYGLEHVFDLTKYFQSFSARSHMLLNGNTLTSLEIYRNQTDYSEHGSLFWTMDRTQTRMGQRLLRKWVGRPLLDRQRLNERVAAVEEIKESHQTVAVDRTKHLLGKVRADLEKSLIRIYYRKCTRPELLGVLQTLQMIAQEYAHVTSTADAGFQSEMLNKAIASLPKIADDVVQFLERINAQAAKTDDKYGFLRGEHETDDITNHKVGIVAVEHDLNGFKMVAADKLKTKMKVDYVTVAGIDYLIEVENTQLKNVPASWAKISGTKKVSRYHAPEVVKLIRERDQHKEALANACDAAFTDLLTEIGSKYQAFRDCIQSLALLDCLLSLADVASQPGYCKPEFTEEIGIDIEGGRHPMVEQLLLDAFVPNDVHLSFEQTQALLITGPNMGGKSSYVRSVALIAIMAQIGSYVPATSAKLGLLDAVFTRMGAFDNMMKGESTFMVELSETSDILKQATPRSLIILDELGRGTSTHDGVAIAQAVLHHVVAKLKSLTLFITHYQSLARIAEKFDGELKNVHMRFTEQETQTGEKDVTFLYEVGEGVAHRSYGLNVAKLAGLPKSLLEEASRRSKQMEEEESRRRLNHLSKIIGELAVDGGSESVERLVAAVEQI
ncbi:Mismatch repair protein msh3 [Extremus antarcticus]|uniref:DNA mismatch repair protein MSH3 n=1 Tax=Extremus antarcticus TaxID=702011 RepID=A0AAJ0G5J7_9PEZI|nr:Mismatch repair protein msh3 [Extremus antarcticus]